MTLELPAQVAEDSTKSAFSGTPVKSEKIGRKNIAPAKATKIVTTAAKAIPVDESDPIDVAMRDRKAAGSMDTAITPADAKKKKLQIPQPFNLQI